MVFQHRKKVKSVEQWCFSIGKNDEELLTMVFVGRCCFVATEKKRLNETIVGMKERENNCCVVSSMKDGEEMGKSGKRLLNSDGGKV
jgi:hypothetical protein